MSDEEQPKLPPIPEHDEFCGLVRDVNGEVSGWLKSSLDGEKELLSERFFYNDMLKAAEWSRDLKFTLPKWSEHYAERAKQMHFALAKIQAEKLRLGHPLRTPLTPHADVPIPDPDVPVPTPD